MTKKQHRLLMTISLSLTSVGGLLNITDPTALGVPAHTWGFVCLCVGIVGLVANTARIVYDSEEPKAS